MSTTLMRYVLEASLIWGALLLFYLLAFRDNGNWQAQRRYLLLSWTLGILLPLLPQLYAIDAVVAERLPVQLIDYAIPSMVPDSGAELPAKAPIPWFYYLLRTWQAGAIVTFLLSLAGLLRHLPPRPDSISEFAGFRVVKSAQVRSPYTAFRTIYLPEGLSAQLEHTALLHEAAHLRNGHSYEQLWLLIGRCIFWYHPLAWAYSQLLSNVHEYEADAVVTRTISPVLYGRQLLKATLTSRLVPGLFSSPLKRRIMYLTNPVLSQRFGPVRWAALTVLLAGLFLACNKEEPAFNEQAWVASVDATITEYPPRLTPGYSIGSMWHTLLDTIYQEVSYPEAARAQGLYGSVLLKMDIDKNGKATYAPIPAQPRPSGEVGNDLPVKIITYSESASKQELNREQTATPLTQEVERIAAYLSNIKWQPASKNGIPVEGSLYITFQFAFEE